MNEKTMEKVWILYAFFCQEKNKESDSELDLANLLFIILYLWFRRQKGKLDSLKKKLKEFKLLPSSFEIEKFADQYWIVIPDILDEFIEEGLYVKAYKKNLKRFEVDLLILVEKQKD